MTRKIKVGDIPLKPQAPKQKPLGKVSGLLLGLTGLVSVWLLYEVGLLKFSQVAAAEKAPETTSFETLQRSVQDREKAVQEKEEAIAKRELAVSDKEAALAEQIKGYEKTIQELEAKAQAPGPKVEEKPDEFLSIYEKMEAKKAAKVFEKLDVPVATKFLKKMSPSRAAEILGLMPPDRAKAITERHLSKETASARDSIQGQ